MKIKTFNLFVVQNVYGIYNMLSNTGQPICRPRPSFSRLVPYGLLSYLVLNIFVTSTSNAKKNRDLERSFISVFFPFCMNASSTSRIILPKNVTISIRHANQSHFHVRTLALVGLGCAMGRSPSHLRVLQIFGNNHGILMTIRCEN